MPEDNKTPQSNTGKTASTGGTREASQGASSTAQGGQGQTTDAKSTGAKQSSIEMLKADHRKVEQLFTSYEQAEEAAKSRLIEEICRELVIHTMIEERVFYPACREAASDDDLLDEAQVEHDATKVLIGDLMMEVSGDEFRDAKVKVLFEEVKHHVAEEEKPSTGIMAKAKAAGVDTPDLAQRLSREKQKLQARGDQLPAPRPVSFNLPSQSKEDSMARHNGERDERGRFTDDNNGGGGRRSYASRDDEGRFTSRGRDDDDGRRSGGGGHGGWFGDSEGHSEASRRGWDEREGGSRSSRYEDDRRYSQGRDDDDGRRSGGRGHGGWFGDAEGHSEASRRGWDEREGGSRSSSSRDDDDRRYSRGRDYDDDRRSSDRGQGGWFGDSRGHSEAAREGWEERRGSSSSYRSRDDDDDRRSRGRGHGGWFGDERGHSEAAREGWDRRR